MAMPPHPSPPWAPGVYTAFAPTSDHTIVGVSTSVTAFAGYMRPQMSNAPVQVSSMADVERIFGPVAPEYPTSYSLLQYFRNGGQTAWVANASPVVPPETVSEAGQAQDAAQARESDWAVRIASTSPVHFRFDWLSDTQFIFNANEYGESAGKVGITRSLSLGPLSTIPTAQNYAAGYGATTPGVFAWVSAISELAGVQRHGTVGGPIDLSLLDEERENGQPHTLRVFVGAPDDAANVDWNDVDPVELGPFPSLDQVPSYLEAALLRRRVRSRVAITHDGRIAVVLLPAGTADDLAAARSVIRFEGVLARALGLEGDDVSVAPQAFVFEPEAIASTATPAAELAAAIGRCETIEVLNLLCVPDVFEEAAAFPDVYAAATLLYEKKQTFFIADMPNTVTTPQGAQDFYNSINGKFDGSAIYFPSLIIGDPADDFRPKAVPPSGTLAGLYARTDANRGVWKAPAGTTANLVGVLGMTYKLNDAENGTLNPLGINALRILTQGNVAWGARTLRGADLLASQWKYIPVMRLGLYIRQSLQRGLVWAVFEPNFAPLWQSISLSVSSFMQTIFVQGGFKGTTPSEAYFVQCGAETTTPTDIDQGWVNVVVGFAPLKPAEFVIVSFRQMTKSAAQ
jgi:uncharacterized protein